MQGNLIFNLIASLITFLLSVVISMWMTPFIIKSIGTEAYGFIPLTQNFISIMSVLTVALSSVIARFITVAIKQNDHSRVQYYFNTYLFSALILSGVLVTFFFILAIFVDKIIDVPNYLLFDVRISIIISGLLLITTYIGTVFIAAPFSANKLYITKGIEALNALVKSVLIIGLLTLLMPKIWYVNLGAFIAGLISFILNVAFFKKILPFIKINCRYFKLSYLSELLTSGIWNSIGQVGVLLFLAIDIFVANITLGAEKAGVYAAILQFPLLLRTLAGIIAGVFAPVIISHYAKKNMYALVQYANHSVKLNGLLISLPASLICGLAGALLSVWLGPDFAQYKWLLILNAIYLIFVLSIMPLNHIFTAVNKLKVPAIVTILLGILNLILAIILSGYTSLGLYGILIAGATALTLKNFIFVPLYSAYVTGQPYNTYFKGIFQPIIGALVTIIISIIIQRFYSIENWIDLIFGGLFVSIFYILFSYLFLLNKEEKLLINSIINRFIPKK